MACNTQEIQAALQYVFSNEALLYEALTHRSYSQTQEFGTVSHNERLEFLGDAVLGLVISESLMEVFSSFTEGELSKAKAGLISRGTLAQAAGRLGLGQWLLLGRGEEVTSGRQKHSLLANALEALIGAVYLDNGLDATRSFVHRVLAKEFSALREKPDLSERGDWKSRLQELVHKHEGASPRYRLINESGPDHEKTFSCLVEVRGNVMGQGEGRTKKEAEQRAAEQAVIRVKGHVSDTITNSHE